MMGIGNRSVQQWLKCSRDHLTGWKRSWWNIKLILEWLKFKYYTWWFCVLSTFSFHLFHGLVSVCWVWVKNRLCVAAEQQFIRSVSAKSEHTEVQCCWRWRDGWSAGLHKARFQSAALLRAGFFGALWMRLLVVSGESETVERRKKGLMVLRWAHLGRSQTRVPGLALSCPYHCTSASSEQRGLLRKQLSLKDLQGKHQQRKDEDCRRTWVASKCNLESIPSDRWRASHRSTAGHPCLRP